jgi:uncharacterized protein YkwD
VEDIGLRDGERSHRRAGGRADAGGSGGARRDQPGPGRSGRYARELRRYRSYYRGRIVWEPGNPVGLRTSEGIAPVDEAIRFLGRQPPLPPLAALPLLARAAADHVADQGPRAGEGHEGSDGSTPADRIRRRGGSRYGWTGEVIAYGPETPVAVVRGLIIDDGVPGRGHRMLLFSGRYLFAGAACGPHRGWRFMCVVEVSDSAAAK